MSKRNIEITEPAMVGDTFATGMSAPEILDGVVRLVYFADRAIGRAEERAVVFRLVMTREAYLEALAQQIRMVGCPV